MPKQIHLLIILSILLTGCGTIPSEIPQSDSSQQLEETKEIEQAPTYEQSELVTNLSHPWGITWLQDGRILITERDGRLYIFSNDGQNKREITGTPEIFTGGQAGLLDISVNPKDTTEEWIYFTYSSGSSDANRTQVARYKLDESQETPRLTNEEIIFTNNEFKSGTQHFGSRIAWLSDGTMLVSVGDGGNPPVRFEGELIREQAQEPTTLFGNIVRINPDGSIPEDNPFIENSNYQPELFTVGHRNIQGLAVDQETNQIWASEHGSRGGDELNLIVSGENYGWPLVSHSREYVSLQPVAEYQTLEGYIDPRMVWSDTVAPSGLTVDGNTIYAGGLVSQSVHIIKVDDQSQFISEKVIEIGQRVRDVKIGPDNNLWVLTDDDTEGKLITISL